MTERFDAECEDAEKSPISAFAPLWLTAALCVVSLLSALDFGYGVGIFGMILMMAACGIFAVMMMIDGAFVSLANAAASLLILYFASGSQYFVPALGAGYLLLALLLSKCAAHRGAKTATVERIAVLIFLYVLAVGAVFYAVDGHSLAPKALMADLDGFFHKIKLDRVANVMESADVISDSLLAFYERLGLTKEMLVEAQILSVEAAVDRAELLLPGLLIAAVQILSYFAVSVFCFVAKRLHAEVLLPSPRWALYPTQVSCVVYIITAILYMISSFFGDNSMFAIIVMNLLLVLLPSMTACGVRGLVVRLKDPAQRGRVVVILALFGFGCLFMTGTVLPIAAILLAFLGAKDVSLMRMIAAEQNKKE